jgi:hypothetical protein
VLAIAKKRGNLVKDLRLSAARCSGSRGRPVDPSARRDDPRRMADMTDTLTSTRPKPLRLYRGLTRPYAPVRVQRATGTDFTDCPFTALRYAASPKGVVLVLDAPAGSPRVREELWLVTSAKRFMIWGAFDDFILAELAAKELRAHVRRKGVVGESDEYKAAVLRRAIMEHLPRSRSIAQ